MAIYEIDSAHSVAEFGAKHLMFATVKGRLGEVKGEIEFDESDPQRSSVVATADAVSLATGDPRRDAHLRSPDFFDAENFPMLTFKSRRIEQSQGDGGYRITGDLTVRDVTQEVVFDATYFGQGADPWGGTRAGFNAVATVNRKDFGLQWNVPLEAGGVLVGETVNLNIEIEAVKKN